MIFNLLENEGFDLQTAFMLILFAVLIVVVIVMYVLGNKKRKQQEKEAQDLINAVKPGNKVKTIGGICGIVVEVDDEENTFVLETGSVQSGKCFLKFDKQAIYQTDAVAEKAEKTEEPEEKTEDKAEKDEKAEEKVEAEEVKPAPVAPKSTKKTAKPAPAAQEEDKQA